MLEMQMIRNANYRADRQLAHQQQGSGAGDPSPRGDIVWGQTMLWRTNEGNGLTQPRGKNQGPQCGLGHLRTSSSFLYVVKPKHNQLISPHPPLLPFPQPHPQILGGKSDEQQALLMTGYRAMVYSPSEELLSK